MKYLYLFMLPMLMLCACGGGKHEENASAVTLKDGIIHISEESPVLSKLKTESVRKSPYRIVFTTSGIVQAIPSRYAEVASPVSGRITKSFVRLGQQVATGSPIFEISAPDVYEAGKAYYQARQEMELAQKNLKREQDLMRNKVGVQKELEAAEVDYELKKKDYESMAAALRVFQINPEELILGQPLIVRSPINGTIVKDQIVIGQYIKEDADPAAIVADLSRVWVVAHVKEKDLRYMNALDKVEIQLVSLPNQTITGQIFHVSEMLDPETRSVEVIIECDNSDRKMKPEMYGTIRLSDQESDVIRIPTAAILQQEEGMYVLLSQGNNNYKKQPVEAGMSEEGMTLIERGLTEGDQIVVEGAFYLMDIH